MASSTSGWARVAEGLRMVATAHASQTAERGTYAAASLTKHGLDVASSARMAAAAAGITASNTSASSTSWVGNTKAWNQNNSTMMVNSSRDGIVGDNRGEKKKQNFSVHEEYALHLRQDGTRADFSITDKVDSALDGDAGDSGEKSTFVSSNAFVQPPKDTLKMDMTAIDTVLSGDIANQLDKEGNHHASQSEEVLVKNSENAQEVETPNTTYNTHIQQDQPTIREGSAVPSSRIERVAGFASLGIGLAAGTAFELGSRILSPSTSTSSSAVGSDANAHRIASSLGRMRGAALKLGQMLSIQDETLLPPALAKALREVVHQGADSMPLYQLNRQMSEQLGDEHWRESKLVSFEDVPIAAASIGQVHRAQVVLLDNVDGKTIDVAMKVQYPGVANSIESDLSNLQTLVKLTGLAPPGLFIDEVIRVGRKEVLVECDYEREMENQIRFKALVENDAELVANRFVVPGVISHLTTKQILTTELAPGGTIDKVANLNQEERNRIGRGIMRLTMKELFEWRFMQTDPNWGNFLYDVNTKTTSLIDFGAAREYDKHFVDGYLKIVWAAANQDTETLLEQSHKMKFLTGDENDTMIEAHTLSGLTVGEPFSTGEAFDFRTSNISARISKHGSAFMQHRLTPPPEEVYTLHRKLAGAYMICIKLGAVVHCRDLLEDVMNNYTFDDDHEQEEK